MQVSTVILPKHLQVAIYLLATKDANLSKFHADWAEAGIQTQTHELVSRHGNIGSPLYYQKQMEKMRTEAGGSKEEVMGKEQRGGRGRGVGR